MKLHLNYSEIYFLKKKNSTIKRGYTYNNQSMYPNNLERQKVQLAFRIFNAKFFSSLKSFNKKSINSSTANFISIITKF